MEGPSDESVVTGAVECPTCGGDVDLEAEPCEWAPDGGVEDWGPGIGDCCGWTFLEQPDGSVEVYRLGEGPA